MIISDLSHLENVCESQGIVGGISFNVYNNADVDQDAKSYAYGSKVTTGNGSASVYTSANASNYSNLYQSNYVNGIGIDP